MFDVSLKPASDEDIEGTIAVALKPLPGSQFAQKFYVLNVWVDRETHMPAKIELHRDEAGTRIQTTLLRDLKINTGLTDKDFELLKINPGEWSLHEEAYQE
jgi:outer membrane lipoprotein-sorting protein